MKKNELVISSSEKQEVLNITDRIKTALSDYDDGLIVITIPHTTAALIIGEDDEELRKDYLTVSEKLLLPLGPFKHIRNNNPNAAAHIMSSAFGTNISLPLRDGTLDLGKYQNIIFIELDGPKERTINLNIFSTVK